MTQDDKAAIQRMQAELEEIEGRLNIELTAVTRQKSSPTTAKRVTPIAIQLGGIVAARAALETIT
jgi:hypothetical protein